MHRRFYVMALALLFSLAVLAGIRSAREYSGVVIEDRWGTFYIYAGTYLMYVSKDSQELLRDYIREPITIDAIEVFQPMNPGDGLIKRFVVLDQAPMEDEWVPVSGIVLVATPQFDQAGPARFQLLVENRSDKPIKIGARDLGITVLTRKAEVEVPVTSGFDWTPPSDGSSHALLTRQSFWGSDAPETYGRYWELQSGGFRKPMEKLKAGESRLLTVTLRLPPGEYEFLFGYGGGVLESLCVASNQVRFNIGKDGTALLWSGNETGVAQPND
jgi:hypothetical protein